MHSAIVRKITRRVPALFLSLLLFVPALTAQASPLRCAAIVKDFYPFEQTSAEDYPELALSLETLSAAAGDTSGIPDCWPVKMDAGCHLTSTFGYREDPVTGDSVEFHAGIDLADKLNTKIYAAGSGIVLEVEESSGYGLYILIDHGNGYTSRYSHLNTSLVEAGEEITKGQLIGTMGASGRVTGVHLDFRIYLDGTAVDPISVLSPLSES